MEHDEETLPAESPADVFDEDGGVIPIATQEGNVERWNPRGRDDAALRRGLAAV